MNRTPPEANIEYSRGTVVPGGGPEPRETPESAAPQDASERSTGLAVGLFAAAMLGALLLLVAEFTTLFSVHVSGSSKALQTVSGGSHHSWAMALIGVCAVVLAIAVWRAGSRPALAGIGLLGVVALLIALLGDLSDATASGLILTSSHYIEAKSTPSAGFFIETLGALLLIVACVWGFLLTAPAPRPPDSGKGAPAPASRRSAL